MSVELQPVGSRVVTFDSDNIGWLGDAAAPLDRLNAPPRLRHGSRSRCNAQCLAPLRLGGVSWNRVGVGWLGTLPDAPLDAVVGNDHHSRDRSQVWRTNSGSH